LLTFLRKKLIILKSLQKMKKLLIPLVISISIMIIYFSCKKADTINDPSENLVSQEILKKVTDFITAQTEQEVNKPKLNDYLITTAAHLYNINQTEKIVVIGIRESFTIPVITIKNTIKYFMAKLDGSDNVLSGNIIELVSGDKLTASTAEKIILTNYTKSSNSFTGILINLSTTNQYLDEITYNSGKIINTKKLEDQSPTNLAARSCLVFYLNVYEDGILVSSTYLYAICTGNGAGSGTGCEQTRMVDNTTAPLELKNCGGGGGSNCATFESAGAIIAAAGQQGCWNIHGFTLVETASYIEKQVSWEFYRWDQGFSVSGVQSNDLMRVRHPNGQSSGWEFVPNGITHSSYTEFGDPFPYFISFAEKFPPVIGIIPATSLVLPEHARIKLNVAVKLNLSCGIFNKSWPTTATPTGTFFPNYIANLP
jgi:hypothetical protein